MGVLTEVQIPFAVTSPTPVAISQQAPIPPYQLYIDPQGLLFGTTPCGLLNYVDWQVCTTTTTTYNGPT